MKISHLSALLLALTLAACGGGDDSSSTPAAVTSTRFAVFSDPHLYDMATLGDSADLDAYLLQDRKMLKQSSEILDTVLSNLDSSTLDFVLVTGDLSKDGELVDHQLMASKLARLKASGKKVFVIPGNHDIYNPDARTFKTSPPSATTQTTPADFHSIYASYGYNDALYTDSNSLSYVAEPVSGVWLFAIDSCQYASTSTSPITAGAINAATQAWIVAKLQEAQQKGKQVIGMMHHGLLEHYTGQATLYPEYVVNDYAAVGKSFAANGLKVMFTGHYHANDIASAVYSNNTLYDVETGSTVTAPSPYRLATLDLTSKQLAIATRTVSKTASHPSDFVSYAKSYLIDGLMALSTYQFTHAPYNLDASTAASLAPLVSNAMAAHYAGDEKLSDATAIATLTAMMSSANATIKMMGQSIYSLWTDTGPADNNVTLTLGSK